MNIAAKLAVGSALVAGTLYGIRQPTDQPRYRSNFHQLVHKLNLQRETVLIHTAVVIGKNSAETPNSLGSKEGIRTVYGPVCSRCGHVNIMEVHSKDSKATDSYTTSTNLKAHGSWVTYDEIQKMDSDNVVINDKN